MFQQLLPSQGASPASYQMQAVAAMEGQYHRLASAVNAGSAGVGAAPPAAVLVTAPPPTSSELLHGGAIQLKDLAHHVGGVSTSACTSTVNNVTTSSSELQTVRILPMT